MAPKCIESILTALNPIRCRLMLKNEHLFILCLVKCIRAPMLNPTLTSNISIEIRYFLIEMIKAYKKGQDMHYVWRIANQ